MPTSKALRETRASTAEDMQKMSDLASDSDHEWSEEDEEKWKRANADYDAQSTVIEKQERMEHIQAEETRQSEVIPGRDDFNGQESTEQTSEDLGRGNKKASDEDRSTALQAWFRADTDNLVLEQRHIDACKRVGVNPNSRGLSLDMRPTHVFRKVQRAYRNGLERDAESRALSAIQGSAGAFLTAPEELSSSLEIALLTFGGMRQVSEIIRTASGAPFVWPTFDDTSNTGSQIGENTTVSEQDIVMGARVWMDYKFTSDMIKVPVELLEDEVFSLPSIIGSALGERLGRIQNTKFTVGSGAATPEGITVGSTAGVTTAASTAIVFDEMLDLEASVDPAYRPGSTIMFHDNVRLALRKLKDGEGRYLWESNVQLGQPDRILSYPFVVNQDMSSTITSGDITVEFGQFNKYKIRDIGALRMIRLNERFADTDQVAFLAFTRNDGKLLDAGTNPVKHMVQV